MRIASGLSVSASVLTLSLGISEVALAIPVIDTTGDTVTSSIYPFGETQTATFGQTFTVTGGETQLNSFGFRFDDYAANGYVIDFATYVYAWDGQKAGGGQLFASGQRSSTNNGGLGGWETFMFDTGGISLVSGQQYVAFMSASLFFDGTPGVSTLEMSNGYAGGNLVYDRNGSDFSQLTTQTWDSIRDGFIGTSDTWFIANFSTPTQVPEPGTLALLLTGMAGVVFTRRRRPA